MQNIESSYAKYRKLLRFTPNIPPKINFSNYSLVDVYLPPPNRNRNILLHPRCRKYASIRSQLN